MGGRVQLYSGCFDKGASESHCLTPPEGNLLMKSAGAKKASPGNAVPKSCLTIVKTHPQAFSLLTPETTANLDG